MMWVGFGTESDSGGGSEGFAEVQEGMHRGKRVFAIWDVSITT